MNMFSTFRTTLTFIGAVTLATTAIDADQTSPAASTTTAVLTQSGTIAHGHAVFETYCSVCHGAKAMGFIGPRIGGIPWTAQSLGTIVRSGLGGYGGMPAFSPDSVSDADIVAVASYLAPDVASTPTQTVAANPPAAASPVPSAATSSESPDAAAGAKLYEANCAACHGAKGEGGYGPSLHGEKSRKDFAAAVTWIENPAPPMPKLYPSPLSKQEVEDVAAFVEKL